MGLHGRKIAACYIMDCQHFTKLWYMAFALICHFPKEGEREDPYFHVPRTWLLNIALLIFAPHNYFMGDVLHTIEYLASSLFSTWASLVAQMVNNLPTMLETWVWFLGQKDPLEKGMATHSSTLAWRIPWTEDPGGQSQRARYDWAINTLFSTC